MQGDHRILTADHEVELSFVVPCYNEEKNVERALSAIAQAMVLRDIAYEVLVIDDGSADKTEAVVAAYQSAHPEIPVRFHRHALNQGLGATYLEGAFLARGEYYLLVNGDGDLPVETILAIVDRRGEAEIISPYLVNQRDRPLVRRIFSFLFTKLVGLLGGHRLRYYTGPVLHRRVNVLSANVRARGFGYQAELLCALLGKGHSVVEVPFSSDYRHHQTDAFHPANFFSVSKSLYRIFWRRVRRPRG